MKAAKRLGIWMDHSSAHLMEFTTDPITTKIITSKFTHESKESTLETKGEFQMHDREQHQQAEYYKELGEAIIDFDDVILFGPTNAKVELYNILRDDHLFEKINIKTEQTDKMTENQKLAFIKDYFSKH